ncbi:uncharacterized protein A4U43_C10F19410 [Asparagus officinalis]|uniref:Gnk2-homologous domain-containing protein n=1 Tax=Asparagus officinalis TaxID=4686 RepID=A0A5P1E3Z0_ASPOF|nr:cysteine-rich repeat secretory protein 11-like [Asparagus officinalis]ONK57372.1 uncharacterized protein A4U43_C10F19410 [Asparagus officinalis]
MGCASNGGGSRGPASQQALSALSSALIAQSASSKFFKTSSSSTGQQISGLFQCREDLSSSDCAACVQHLLPMWSSLCGSSVAARIQLTGCYALYQVSGFPQASGTQMLFKTCGSGSAGSGFEQKREIILLTLIY